MFEDDNPYVRVLLILVAATALACIRIFAPSLMLLPFLVILAGLVLVALYVLAFDAWTLLAGVVSRRRAVPAQVVRKSTRMYGYDSPLSGRGIVQAILKRSVRPRGAACLRHVCWLTFGTRDGEMEFAVPEPLYAALPIGCEGTLTFRGERFVKFEPHVAETESQGALSRRQKTMPR